MPLSPMNNPNLTNGREWMAAILLSIGVAVGWVAGLEILTRLWGTGWLTDAWSIWQYLRAGLVLDTTPPILGYVPAACAVIAGGLCGGFGWWLGTQQPEHHVRGYVLRRHARHIAHALRPARNTAGIAIHPKVRIDQDTETRHFLMLGGSGSGKTTVIWPILQQAVARGDRLLVFDFKGDFTRKWTGAFSLLAPWDSRSERWSLGYDIRTRLDAEALATTLVPAPTGNADAIWSQGARGLLVGLIARLQRQHGEHWGLAHLAKLSAEALADYDLLVEVVGEENPIAKSFLLGHDSKTTASFLAQLAGAMSDVVNLGVGQYSMPKNPVWSVTSWLTSDDVPPTAIIGYLPDSEDLSRAWASSIIEQATRKILSLSDCRPDKRRIWLILDEVAQAGKIPSITSALTAARSKGCRVALGLQSVAQVREIYGRETATVWAGQTASKIVCHLGAPDDQKWASDLLGEREVDRYQRQTSSRYLGEDGQHSETWQRVREPVLMPAEFGRALRITKNGARALIMCGSEAAILNWPFPELAELRPDRSQAAWVLPGYQRPMWGTVPPKIATPPPGPSAGMSVPARKSAPTAERPEASAIPLPPPKNPVTKKSVVRADSGLNEAADVVADHIAVEPVADMIVPGAGTALTLAKIILGVASSTTDVAVTTPSMPSADPQTSQESDEEEPER